MMTGSLIYPMQQQPALDYAANGTARVRVTGLVT